jgi:hypothetical protein
VIGRSIGALSIAATILGLPGRPSALVHPKSGSSPPSICRWPVMNQPVPPACMRAATIPSRR